jgi:3-phosphoshikimate 1-carboxyvinyltransferase
MPPLPARLAVTPRGPLDAAVRVPGSKSITNRALLIAALAKGESELRGALASDDTRVMFEALGDLGCEVRPGGESWTVRGTGGRLRAPDGPLMVGNSGTTARFLTVAAALADGPVVIDGSPRMRERPIDDLARALVSLGVPVEILGRGGCPPVRVGGGGLPGGAVAVDASRSSQYVSALLLSAPYAARDLTLRFSGGTLVSRPYVELTLQVMRAFGAEADWNEAGGLSVRAGRPYCGRTFEVEPDASAAAYPFCAAAIVGGRVRVEGIPPDSVQADFGLLEILGQMGCRIRRGADFAEVEGPPGPLRGIDLDMNDLPDAVLALAVVALFAEGQTRIRNVANLRIKETDSGRPDHRGFTHRRSGAAAGGRDRDVRRPPHGHGLRPGGPANSGRRHSGSGVCIEDVARVLLRSRTSVGALVATLSSGLLEFLRAAPEEMATRPCVEPGLGNAEIPLLGGDSAIGTGGRAEPEPVDLHRSKRQAGTTARTRPGAVGGTTIDLLHGTGRYPRGAVRQWG